MVLRYTGVKEDLEEVLNARLAVIADPEGKPLYRFLHSDPKTGAKSGSKFRRVDGMEVEFRPMPFPQYEGADDIFALALSTQTKFSTPAVQLFFVDLYWFQTFSSSWLMPFEGKEWAPTNFKHDFLEACRLRSPDGEKRVYAIPFSAKGNMLYCRKDVLDLFGLSMPDTWDALRYAVQSVRELVGSPNYPGNLEELALKRYPELKTNLARRQEEVEKWKKRLGKLRFGLLLHSQGFHNDFFPIVWGYGGDIFTSDPQKQQLGVQALRDIKAMMYDDSAYPIKLAPPDTVFEGPLRESSAGLQEMFVRGEALFMVDWDSAWDAMLRHDRRTVAMESIGICPIPHTPEHESTSNIGSWGWVVNRQAVTSGDPDRDALSRKAVEQFLHDLTSEEAQEWFAEHNGFVPSREMRLSEPVLAKLERTHPTVVTLFRFFRTKGLVRFVNRPGSKRLNDVLEQALHRAIAATPEKDPVAELNSLSKVLADVRMQAESL
jgi:ABC-type glycerol-3-phosphate transport system substrate-binding protein